jgi:hypothetical protein
MCGWREGGGAVAGGRVRKQNVCGCRTGTRLRRRVVRCVSPGAEAGAVVGGGDVMVGIYVGGKGA